MTVLDITWCKFQELKMQSKGVQRGLEGKATSHKDHMRSHMRSHEIASNRTQIALKLCPDRTQIALRSHPDCIRLRQIASSLQHCPLRSATCGDTSATPRRHAATPLRRWATLGRHLCRHSPERGVHQRVDRGAGLQSLLRKRSIARGSVRCYLRYLTPLTADHVCV